jgi:hypothetical protein
MPLLWLSGFALMIAGAFLWMLSTRMASQRPA